MTINGIDLYHGNSMPDLTGYDFLIHKATQGATFVDPLCQQRIGQARALGLVTGMYHFLTTKDPISAQVSHFLDTAQPVIGDVLALDFEDDGTWPTLTRSDLADIGYEFLSMLNASVPEHRILLYCSWNTYDFMVTPFGVPVMDGLWIAEVGPEPQLGQVIWQYSSAVYDQDKAYFATRDDMQLWADKPRPTRTIDGQTYLLLGE